jgi:hypothetical protein
MSFPLAFSSQCVRGREEKMMHLPSAVLHQLWA